jgi:hypothetical protein
MEQGQASSPDGSPAAGWLKTHATVLFAAIRRVVPDSLCAYDLGLELSAHIGHRWDSFDAERDGNRTAWAIRLATDLIADATARGLVPAGERHRGGEPSVVELSAVHLDDLSRIARASLHLDEHAGDALAAMERSAPSPGALSRLRPSNLVLLSHSGIRQDA